VVVFCHGVQNRIHSNSYRCDSLYHNKMKKFDDEDQYNILVYLNKADFWQGHPIPFKTVTSGDLVKVVNRARRENKKELLHSQTICRNLNNMIVDNEIGHKDRKYFIKELGRKKIKILSLRIQLIKEEHEYAKKMASLG